MTPEQTSALIQAVRDVSAREILPLFRNLNAEQIDSKSAADDLVTVADRAAELALTEAAQNIFPGCAVVGEEAVSSDASILERIGTTDQVVIIDPIDGTWNFANGLANFGVIVAVVEQGETVFGLLYDPSHDDWIMAHRGEGCWFCRPDQTPLRLHTGPMPDQLEDTLGLIGVYLFTRAQQAQIVQTLPLYRRSMTLRCSLHEYRLQAQGHAQFCLNGMLNPWDHAAGVLCLQEAGGVARLIDGTPYAPTMTEGFLLTAGGDALWDKLAEVYSFLR